MGDAGNQVLGASASAAHQQSSGVVSGVVAEQGGGPAIFSAPSPGVTVLGEQPGVHGGDEHPGSSDAAPTPPEEKGGFEISLPQASVPDFDFVTLRHWQQQLQQESATGSSNPPEQNPEKLHFGWDQLLHEWGNTTGAALKKSIKNLMTSFFQKLQKRVIRHHIRPEEFGSELPVEGHGPQIAAEAALKKVDIDAKKWSDEDAWEVLRSGGGEDWGVDTAMMISIGRGVATMQVEGIEGNVRKFVREVMGESGGVGSAELLDVELLMASEHKRIPVPPAPTVVSIPENRIEPRAPFVPSHLWAQQPGLQLDGEQGASILFMEQAARAGASRGNKKSAGLGDGVDGEEVLLGGRRGPGGEAGSGRVRDHVTFCFSRRWTVGPGLVVEVRVTVSVALVAGGILCDPPGSGKTVCVLGLLARLFPML